MPNIKISALPPATLPLDDPNTLFEVTVFEAGEEVSRKITLSEIAGATGLDASFVTVGANAQLPNERVLTAGTDISIVDGGPNSTITISSTAGTSFPLLAPDGSAAAPSYSFVNDTGAGMFLTALGELSFAADGVEIARAINLVNNQFAVAQSGSSSVPDLTSLADLDTGFRFPANNETVWMGGGSRAWNFSTVKFYSQFSNGGAIFNRVSQNDVPTLVPDHADDNTGIGADGGDELSLIAGGIEIAQAKEVVGANQFIIAPGVVQNNAAAPSLAFGDGNTGFYEGLDNNFSIAVAGVQRFFWELDAFNAVSGIGPAMLNQATSGTVPGFVPRRSDPNTGLGSAGGDILSSITGGIEAVRYAEVSSQVLQTNSSEVGIVASAVQTQGQQPLISSYNEVNVVSNPDDVVTAPSVTQGLRLIIVNNGGSDLQVFPASGDNIGGGIDGSITMAAGNVGVFLGRNGIDWDTLYNNPPSSTATVPDPLLLSSGGVGVPTYSFAVDSDTGMYQISADILGFTAGGVEGLRIEESGGLITVTAAGPLLASNGSETNPSHSFAGDPDCGMYREDTDRLAFTAGGVPAIMYQEGFGTGILAASQNDIGLVASVTQTQAGGLVLRSSYNEVATVATTGDALTLQGPPTLASVTAKHTVVVNNGANDLQLFPALGDDLGAGVNASITVVAGEICVLLGRDGGNWDVLYNAAATPGGPGGVLPAGTIGDSSLKWDGVSAWVEETQVAFPGGATGIKVFDATLGDFITMGHNGTTAGFSVNAATTEVIFGQGGGPSVGWRFEEKVRFPDGSAAVPSIAFFTGGTDGFYRSVGPGVGTVVGGVEHFRVSNATTQVFSDDFRLNPNFGADLARMIVNGPSNLNDFEIELTSLIDFHVSGSTGERFVLEEFNLAMFEKAAAPADVAGTGQFWVRNDVPNTPMFTDDAGTDFVLNAGGGAALPEFQFAPLTLENPNSADWTVNALAPAVADSNNAGLTVRLFDDTTEEGVGFQFEVPAGATNIIFTFRSRAETAPGVVNTVGLDIYNRGIPDNAAVQAWSAATALTDISIPTNEFFQEDSQTVTLATLGVTAGELTQFELVRTAPGAGTDLTGDWALGNLKVSFS